MKLSFKKTLITILMILVLMFSALRTRPVRAATFTVSNGNDSGTGSLRQAIIDANNTAGADSIDFNGSFEIFLSSTLPAITDANGLNIDGIGHNVTINGGNAVRVFVINTGALLTLNKVVITHGKSESGTHGGGIFNSGTLTISNGEFLSNNTTLGAGGAIMNSSGTLAITNTLFTDNNAIGAFGGAIFNLAGTATITASSFFVNNATSGGQGGGIYVNSGTVNIISSMFSGNSAGYGGAAYANSGVLNITNSTFVGNSAADGGGGGIYIFATAQGSITNSTFHSNKADAGGAIFNIGGSVTLRNSILALSFPGANCSGTIANGGNNIDDGTTCGWGSSNGSMSSTDAKMTAFGNYGGLTQTFALQATSPAINGVIFNAPNGAPSTDQRGVARPQGPRADIGAFESETQSGPTFNVNSLAETDDGYCDPAGLGLGNKDCTLREAINMANAMPAADTITFSVNGTIILGSQLPNIQSEGGALTLDGTGHYLTIYGNNSVRVLFVNPSASLTINHLTISRGYTLSNGAGIYNEGGLILNDVSFIANVAATGVTNGGGGAIYNSATLTVTNGRFYGNSVTASGGSTGGGGGIYSTDTGTLSVSNSLFSDNISSVHGGGIYNRGTATITNTSFSANYGGSTGNGGGVYHGGTGALSITNSTVSGNSASSGGAVSRSVGTVTLRNTIVANSVSGGNCEGTITNGGNNLDSGTTCGWGPTNGSKSSTNPLLSPLANNGGPSQTFALLPGSPAIDGVTFNPPNNAPSTDQRGEVRPQRGGYDIGAFESGNGDPPFKLFLPLIIR